MKLPRHRYEVKEARDVRSPECGPDAYHTKYRETVFAFGKGQRYQTGEEARNAAMDYATSALPEASEVSIWKCNGYSGQRTYLKRREFPDPHLFSETWSEP